ncbi:MAG: hypothetical protein O3A06_00105 [Proteobacteria bacterium]|nr:hypothetical protein [Pseudomonadota bacterium]MDA0981443.1 hypothetical protein [Pseudomonadota bacterium]
MSSSTEPALGLAFGPWAVAFFFRQSVVAVLQLEAVNYIEHYTQPRGKLPAGYPAMVPLALVPPL